MASQPANAVVWVEIPVTDLKRGMAFYGAVLGTPLKLDESTPKAVADFTHAGGVSGHLCKGTPAPAGQGSTVHLGIAGTAEDAAARCVAAGGTVLGPVIEIPPGRFVYARDPDGNAIGLFEPRR